MPDYVVPVKGSKRATLDELWQQILILEEQHSTRSMTRRVGKSLQPLILFVERFTPAIDVAVQGTINPAALAWGAMRALLIVSSEDHQSTIESYQYFIFRSVERSHGISTDFSTP